MNKIDNKDTHEKLYKILRELEEVASKNNLTYYLAYGTALGAIRERGFIPWDTDLDIMVTIDEYERFCLILESEMSPQFALFSGEKDKRYTALFSRIGLKSEPHHKIHIDIFPMIGSPKSKIGRIVFAKLCYLSFMANYIKKVNIKERLKGHNKVIFVVAVGKVILSLVPAKSFAKIHTKLSRMFSIKDSKYLYNSCGSYGFKEFIPKDWLEETELKEFEGLKLPLPKEWDKYLTHIYGDYMTPKKTNYI